MAQNTSKVVGRKLNKMHRIIWLSDIHLDWLTNKQSHVGTLSEQKVIDFCIEINACVPDSVIITGDISNAKCIKQHLYWLSSYLSKDIKVYFILGNHDAFFGTLKGTPDEVNVLCNTALTNMTYLSRTIEPIKLIEGSYLIGHDGWYDGGYANWFMQPKLQLADYKLIYNFKYQTDEVIYDLMQKQAKEFRFHILNMCSKLPKEKTKEVFIATHVAPFPQLATYNGRQSDSQWLPCFASKIAGDTLLDISENYPDIFFTVLSGHSHGKSTFQPAENMRCYAAEAEYENPEVQDIMFDLEEE